MEEDSSKKSEGDNQSQAESPDITPGLDKELRKKIIEEPEATLPHLPLPQILGGLVYLKLSILSADETYGDTTEEDIQKRLAPIASAITQYRTSPEAEAKGEKWDNNLVDAFNQSLVKEGIIPKPREKKAVNQTTASKENIALEDTVSRIVEDAVGEDYDEGKEEREQKEKEYRELLLKDPLTTLKPSTFDEVKRGIEIIDRQLQKNGMRTEERQRRIQELAQEIIAYKTGKHVQGEESWAPSMGLYLRRILSQEGLTPLKFHPKTSENLRAQLGDYVGGIRDAVRSKK